MRPSKPLKPKPCRFCSQEYTPRSSMQKACSIVCAVALVDLANEKKAEKAKREEKRQDRVRLAAMKRLPQLAREAQIAFNAYIRERDRQAGYTCVSSGRPLDWSGNAVDAGHYRSVGAAPQLRFVEDNVHAQSKHENQYKSGNAVEYRLRLIERIGLARVLALESDNSVKKWTREELIGIKEAYRVKLKELKASA